LHITRHLELFAQENFGVVRASVVRSVWQGTFTPSRVYSCVEPHDYTIIPCKKQQTPTVEVC
jgi:hypothetical protein